MKIETDESYEISSLNADELTALKESIFSRIRTTLDTLKIPRSDYVIGAESATGQLCITLDRSLWVVFASERGERYNPAFFAGAWDAANYFVWELLRGHKEVFPNFPVVPFEMGS